MRKTTLATLTAVTLLSGGMLATQASAMPVTSATALDVATTDTAHLENAALVCGYRGVASASGAPTTATAGAIGTMDITAGPTPGMATATIGRP